MYFLKETLDGMRRRLFSTLLLFLATSSVLLAGATLLLWSTWLRSESGNAKGERQASVFVDSVDDGAITKALAKIRAIPGVEQAKQVAVEEFLAYLRARFPDIAESMQGMAMDAFPSLIEVTLARNTSPTTREAALDGLLSVEGVARVDRGARQASGAASTSIDWLSRGGMVLGASLWLVLFLVALGHYQTLLHRREAEIRLLKSFGAGHVAILTPVALEVLFQSAIATMLALFVILWGQATVVDAFNRFFVSLGFSSFTLDSALLFTMATLMFSAALSAQVLGGITAVVRSKAL